VIELNGSMKMAALLTKSNILLNLGRSEEALTAINKAIDLDPNNTRGWEEKAITCYLLGRYNESLAAYERIIELRSGNVPAWVWKGRGDALKALGRQAEAETDYVRARGLRYLV
jgi:tetratricopeptide (TPR) repeat protein